jgi:hypothetical protein
MCGIGWFSSAAKTTAGRSKQPVNALAMKLRIEHLLEGKEK